MGHQRNALRGRKAISGLVKRTERKRKSWTFEQLEQRLVFSTSPIVTSFSNGNPEGAALTLADELRWARARAANGPGNSSLPSWPNDPLFAQQWYLLNTGQE